MHGVTGDSPVIHDLLNVHLLPVPTCKTTPPVRLPRGARQGSPAEGRPAVTEGARRGARAVQLPRKGSL